MDVAFGPGLHDSALNSSSLDLNARLHISQD